MRLFLRALVLITLFGFNVAYAVAPGLYIGIMGGPARTSGKAQPVQVEGSPTTVLATPKSNQFGARFYVGYQPSYFFGFESGLVYFSSIRYNTGGVPTCAGANVRLLGVDFLGKAMFPLKYFDIFAKAGFGAIRQSFSGSFNPDFTSPSGCGKSSNKWTYKPVAALGATYYFSQSWVADISATRYFVSGRVGNVTMLALGIAYHFVDRYCGQFLCDE